MSAPDLLEHDDTQYADLYERIRELSRNWRPAQADLSNRRDEARTLSDKAPGRRSGHYREPR